MRSLRDIVLPRTTEDRAKGTTTVAFNDCRRGQGMEGSRGSARTWARLAQESDFYSDTTCGADASSTTLSRARTTGPAAGRASALRRRIAAIEVRALGTSISTRASGRITRRSKRTPSSQPTSAEPSCSHGALRTRAPRHPLEMHVYDTDVSPLVAVLQVPFLAISQLAIQTYLPNGGCDAT